MNESTALDPINDLIREVNAFESSLFPPTTETCEHDEIIGECPDELRKFFAYARCCEREMKQISVEMEYATEHDTDQNYRRSQLNKKHDTALAIFWFGLWEYFKVYGTDKSLGLRSKWRVVLHERQTPNLPGIIGGLLGRIE